jgi:hypothetical protein
MKMVAGADPILWRYFKVESSLVIVTGKRFIGPSL